MTAVHRVSCSNYCRYLWAKVANWWTGPRVPKYQLTPNRTPYTCTLVSLVVQFGAFGVLAKVGIRNEPSCAIIGFELMKSSWIAVDNCRPSQPSSQCRESKSGIRLTGAWWEFVFVGLAYGYNATASNPAMVCLVENWCDDFWGLLNGISEVRAGALVAMRTKIWSTMCFHKVARF